MGGRVEGGLEQERLAICLPPLLAQESTGQAPDHCLPGHLVSSVGGPRDRSPKPHCTRRTWPQLTCSSPSTTSCSSSHPFLEHLLS